jgi:hypothetical protein
MPLILAPLLVLPVGAFAQAPGNELSYTYLEGDYVNLDIDTGNENLLEDFSDGGGWAVKGSFAFTPNFFGFASYGVTDSDVSFAGEDTTPISQNEDIDTLIVGLGANFPLGWSRPTDAVIQAKYVDVDLGNFDFGASGNDSLDDLSNDSSDGWGIDAFLRSQITDRIEGTIGAGYLDIQDTNGLNLLASAMFEVTPSIGITAGVEAGSDVAWYNLGVRWQFNRF